MRIVIPALMVVLITDAVLLSGAPAAPLSSMRSGFQPLPKPGEKIPLGAQNYFTYSFVKPPKLGTAVMRVEIFTLGGVRDTSFAVKGDADMPSMRGAHASGDKDFSRSAKGAYLLPVRLVMPGDWEVSLTFVKQGKTVFRGAYLFDL
ncbi:hypothetical protein F6V30_09795 [Oryzomonas sagensis]|uniref:YtkA-like domain-containing protein n=1 Tax=Oryzomonas sagensis TaxID=2603857 RepID=A0ABQ6TP56_9BACT|nr:hypothetical protein [Oryzomonas sagensis]KAB0670431.1 hypothetical protein F6V30_09795 [Oryzomonas sagensis]